MISIKTRNSFGGALLTLAAWSTVASALVGASVSSAAPVLLDRIEASVNFALILKSDIEAFRHTLKLRSQLDPLFSGTALAAKGAKATDAEIRDFLIDEKLITQAFPVGDAEVEQEINSIQANNRIDRAALRSALAEQGFSFSEYFELIRLSASKRNLIDRDIRTKVSISDDDVKNHYYNRAEPGTATAMAYRLELLSVSISNYKTPGAAREVVERAQERIKAGEAFSEVARQVSDHATASSGGELGTLAEDQMSPTIREQVRKLKIGQVSEIFGGPAAGFFALIKLVDVKSSDQDRFNKVKEEIRNQLAASEYQHQISLWLDRQRQTAFIHRAAATTP